MFLVRSFSTISTKSTTDQSYSNLETACDLVKNINTVSAALIMARSEMKEILQVDEKFFQSYKDKVLLYYTKRNGDNWINEEDFDQISYLLDSDKSTVKSSKLGSSKINVNDPGSVVEGFHSGKRYERSIENVSHAFCLGKFSFPDII